MSKEKNLLIQKWAEENLRDDIEDNNTVAGIAIREISNKFRMVFGSENTVLAFYATVYNSIMEVLLSKREKKSEYDINIADRFVIGYSDAEENDDAEKMGSFVPHIFDLNSGKKSYDNAESKTTLEACVEWSSKNINECRDIISDISSVALKNLKDEIGLNFGHDEIPIPLFVTIHECLVSYMKLKQKDSGEYEEFINFASCFDIYCRMNEEKEQMIEYSPTVTMKLMTKSDSIATSKHE